MNRLQELISQELSGDKAWQHASFITQYLRAPGSSGTKKVMDYSQEKLESFGLDKISTIEYPSDKNGTQELTFIGWDVKDASLEVVSPIYEKIVSYDEAPTCIQWWSIPTPPQGVVAELVDVRSGVDEADYIGKDVKGKIVLAHGDGEAEGNLRAYHLAVEKHGAIGFVTDNLPYGMPPYRTRENHPEAISFLRIRTKSEKGWAFAISHLMGKRLRSLLKEGPVRLRAFVDAQNFSGKDFELVGEIRGSELPNEEVWFVSHCSGPKPGGNCASGTGLWLEMARTMMSLIKNKKIKQPRRTIKFLNGIEGDGLNAYLHIHGDTAKNVVAAFVLCSVGDDQIKCGSSLIMYKAPDSTPSFVNDLCIDTIEKVSKDGLPPTKDDTRDIPLIRFSVQPFSPMSDNSRLMMLKIPSPLFLSWPSRHFHTQFYTADKLDPHVVKRCGLVNTYVGLKIADSGSNDVMDIAHIVRAKSIERYLDVSQSTISELNQAHLLEKEEIKEEIYKIQKRGVGKLKYLLGNDIKATISLRSLSDNNSVQQELTRIKEELERRARHEEETIRNYAGTLLEER